jgi:pilus assembly protein CpaE
VSIEVAIVGSTTPELEDLFRAGGIRSTSAALSDLLRFAQPGSKLPQVIVLDMRQRSALPPAVAVLKKEQPTTGFVIVAGKLDPALMLEAMRAGVNEWVTEPVTQADLVAATERVATPVSPARLGKLFAVVGAKGGVGATTLAVNISTTLSSNAKGSTLLIDAHPAGGDAALFLGADPKFSVIDALENTHRLDEAFLKGLVVKTAGPDLLAAPDSTVSRAIDPRRIRAVVELAMRCYRFVVLDMPRSDSLFDETLNLASSITVVATQELAAIRSGSRMATALRHRYGTEQVQIVVNRYDHAAEIGSEDLERAVGSRIGHKFPSNYRLAIDAMNKGKPLVIENHNKLASSFAAYAKSLSGAAKDEAPADKSAGLLSMLTRRR